MSHAAAGLTDAMKRELILYRFGPHTPHHLNTARALQRRGLSEPVPEPEIRVAQAEAIKVRLAAGSDSPLLAKVFVWRCWPGRRTWQPGGWRWERLSWGDWRLTEAGERAMYAHVRDQRTDVRLTFEVLHQAARRARAGERLPLPLGQGLDDYAGDCLQNWPNGFEDKPITGSLFRYDAHHRNDGAVNAEAVALGSDAEGFDFALLLLYALTGSRHHDNPTIVRALARPELVVGNQTDEYFKAVRCPDCAEALADDCPTCRGHEYLRYRDPECDPCLR